MYANKILAQKFFEKIYLIRKRRFIRWTIAGWSVFLVNNMLFAKKEKSDKIWWQPAVQVAIKLSAWIAGPVIIAMFAGKWLDHRFDSKPWLFLISVGIAFLVSMFGIVNNTLSEFKKIEIKNKSNTKNDFKRKN